MYQVIARKYRPQTFEEVVGQAHVKQTLRNAIDQGRIAHGYIFSGPRGTGKTTMARILAMALNCEGGPTSTPDPQSVACKEIAAGASLDVIEIDAASNRRIDDIRELRESVKFRPVRDRYKVFIIDEAHQITNDAFNALLKTLEEPPEWTVFVLCTTEPQAIPATIVSRCQSFAFRAVDLPDVLGHLRKICASEGIEAEDDALAALALAGDGSLRDSLSTLDQAIAAFGRNLEAAGVRDLLGAIPSEMTERILAAIRDANPAAMLSVIDDLFRQGRHPQHFCGELARQFRNLMVMQVAGTDSKLVSAGQGERAAAGTWLKEFSSEDLTRYVHLLLALYQDLQLATQQRFRLEIGLLKLVYAGRLRPIEQVLSELPTGGRTAAPRPAETAPAPKQADRAPSRRPQRQTQPTAPPPQPDALKPPQAPTAPRTQPTPAAPAAKAAPRPKTPAAEAPPGKPAPARPESGSSAPAPSPAAPEPAPERPAPDELKAKLLEAIGNSGEQYVLDAIQASRLERDGRAVTIHVHSDWLAMLELQLQVLEAGLAGLVGGKPDVRLICETDKAPARKASPGRPRRAVARKPAVKGDVRERAQSDPAFLAFSKRLNGRVTNVVDLREISK